MSSDDARMPVANKQSRIFDSVEDIIALSTERMSSVFEDLKKKGDQISTPSLSNKITTDVDTVDSFLAAIAYLNHLIRSHGYSYEIIKNDLVQQTKETEKVSHFITQLKDLDEITKNKLEMYYQLKQLILREIHVRNITGRHLFTTLRSEEGKDLGIAPILRIKMDLGRRNKTEQSIQFEDTLDGLSVIISTLLEIYVVAKAETQKLKEGAKPEIQCIPIDD